MPTGTPTIYAGTIGCQVDGSVWDTDVTLPDGRRLQLFEGWFWEDERNDIRVGDHFVVEVYSYPSETFYVARLT